MRFGAIRRWLLMLAALLAGPAVRAAAPACAVPAGLPVPHEEGPNAREPARRLPIGGYTLALSWMPQHCRDTTGPRADECRAARAAGVPAVAVHGLWPDGRGRDWPQYCAPAGVLPAATVAAHYCATPSAQLIQHEWAKHGTCMAGTDPDRYFALTRQLAARVRLPDLAALSRRPQTAARVAAAVAAANPGMGADMLRLNLNRRGWLEELWLCLDTGFRPRACPATQGGAHGDEQVLIWRGGRQGWRRS